MRRLGKILLVLAAVVLGAFLIFRTPDTDPVAMRAKYGGPPSQFVALGNGLTFHLRDEGPRDAPAIVLLHGSNADLHTWDGWAAALSGNYRVIRFDQIGHGLTGPNPSGDYSPAAFVGTVQAVADKLGLKRFYLAGNSMGGGVAAAYAVAHPERIDGLVLLDSSGSPMNSNGSSNIGFRIAQTPGLNRIMNVVTPRWIIAKSMRQAVANDATASDAAIDRVWELLRFPGNREATRLRLNMPHTALDPAKLAAVRAPTLILWGEKDPLIPVEAGRWFARTIPGSKLIVYPGIGHIPMEEAPQRTAADLAAWLASSGAATEPN